jgi:hypothetical protein
VSSLLRWLSRAIVLTLVIATGAACSLVGALGEPRGGSYPEACDQWDYSARRCEALVERAMHQAGVDEAEVSSVELLPFERQANLGGQQAALVRLLFADGRIVDQAVHCVGVDSGPACMEGASIPIYGAGVDTDVPCVGEPPSGCATLPPQPEADAIAAATPFALAALDIPIDHEGHYEVKVGSATLPDGYLSERAYSLAQPRPEDFWIDEGVRLEVRSDVAGRPPIGSVYRDPFDGPEPVTIYLVFEVTDMDRPSLLEVRDIRVR